jgi:hypothetical protein
MKEKAMGPMEGFTALGGHAMVVSRAAQKLSEEDDKWTVRSTIGVAVTVVQPTRRERLVGWVGDLFLATGAWLKAQSELPSYERA